MRLWAPFLLIVLAGLATGSAARADQEASNVARVAADPYGRCYAKSVPKHVYDPADEPRQQGTTEVYRVGVPDDRLVQRYNWFSQSLFVHCDIDGVRVVRVGPWQRGHDPSDDHLALAFYRGDILVKRYSTLDIAGGERNAPGAIPAFKNVEASVSHYTVFRRPPALTKVVHQTGALFTEEWVIEATTVDGRVLTFDLAGAKRR